MQTQLCPQIHTRPHRMRFNALKHTPRVSTAEHMASRLKLNTVKGDMWQMAITDKLMKECVLSAYTGKRTQCRWCNTPLTGRQRRWCSPACADSAAAQHWFSWSRLYVRDIRDKHCLKCGNKNNLEVNHIKPANGTHHQSTCLHHTDNLETLCKECHRKITNTQRRQK